MHSCILCNNSSQRTVNRNITFHSFPRDPIRRARWVQTLKLTDCTDWHRVCSQHFLPSDFRPGEKRLLWPSALPKLSVVTQTSKIVDDSDMIINTTQLTPTDDLQNLEEPDNSAINNMIVSPSATHSKSPRRSSRKIKPTSFSDDSTYVNSSLILSDQEEEKNNTINKKKKKTKETVTNGMRCSAKNCQNKYPTNNLSFFGFPSDLTIRQIWIKNCGIENLVGPNFTVKSYYKVCGNHFERNMFNNTKKRNRLIVNAVPTIFNNEDSSQLSHSENESIDNVEDSSTIINTDNRIIESSNLQKTKDNQESDNKDDIKTQCQTDQKPHACCIPGCIYSVDYLNEKTNANPKAVALFTPSSVENMNDWMEICGLQLTMDSNVCERHFNPEDIGTRDVFIPVEGLAKAKSLKCDAVPVKIKKYGKTLKRSRVDNGNENISNKKFRLNADKSKNNTKFGELPEDKNIEMIEINNTPTSVLNSKLNLKNESINSLSNITSNSSTENNSQSSLKQILPKIFANNSLSISLQPSFQPNKQASVIESSKVTNAICSLNHNRKLVEEFSITSQHNSYLTNIQSNFRPIIPKNLSNNSSLSITFEKNTDQSAQVSATQSTEVANSTCKIKSEPLDDVPQNISIDESTTAKFPSESNFEQILANTPVNNSVSNSSGRSIKENKQASTGVEIIGLTVLNSTVEVKPEIIDEEIINSQTILNTLVNNSLPVNSSIDSTLKSEPTEDVLQTSVNVSQSNFEQPHRNSSHILLSALQSSSSLGKKTVNNSISNTNYLNCIQNDQELLTSHEVSESLSSIPIIHKRIIENQTYFKSNLPNNISPEIIDLSDQDIPSTILESNSIKDFIFGSKNIVLPNQFWLSFYNSSENSAVFIQRDEFMNPIKRVYFRNSFVPNIYINGMLYEYNTPVKTKCDLENLLEDIDDIIICSGYDGYSHGTCIGYFENTSEEIEVCRNCQNLIKCKYMRKMDANLRNKTNLLKKLKKKVADVLLKLDNTKKQMQQERRRS